MKPIIKSLAIVFALSMTAACGKSDAPSNAGKKEPPKPAQEQESKKDTIQPNAKIQTVDKGFPDQVETEDRIQLRLPSFDGTVAWQYSGIIAESPSIALSSEDTSQPAWAESVTSGKLVFVVGTYKNWDLGTQGADQVFVFTREDRGQKQMKFVRSYTNTSVGAVVDALDGYEMYLETSDELSVKRATSELLSSWENFLRIQKRAKESRSKEKTDSTT